MNSPRFHLPTVAALGLAALLAAAAPAPAAHAEKLLLLTSNNGLVTVDSANPGAAQAFVPISGYGAGERLVGLDTRPRGGALLAVSSASRLYSVNAATGAATAIGMAPFTPAITGNLFSVNFNPTVDRIRFISDTRQNLRLNPDTGAVVLTNGAVDGNEAYATSDPNASIPPAVTGAAYTSSGSDASVTQLYVIESAAGVLALQNPPNNGTLNTVGSLGVGANVPARGFDISNLTERGYANFTVNGVPTLFSVNLATGAATSLGALPTFYDLTPTGPTVPIPGYTALTVPYASGARRQSAAAIVTKTTPVVTGFNVGGRSSATPGSGAALRVLIRGLGPSIGGVANPQLRVYRVGDDGAFNQIAVNNDYQNSFDRGAAVTATGLAPTDPLEPALVLTLQPGNYAARLGPKRANDAGIVRLEVAELD